MKTYPPQKKIGYLGGGQLARMLIHSAQSMGLETYVLSEHNHDPAAQVSHNWQQGSTDKASDLEGFLKSVDVATFESEFLDTDLLARVSSNLKTSLHPSPLVMGQLRDRLSQKQLFDQYKLPTSPWSPARTLKDALQFIEDEALPVVFKKRLFGYDGHGTFVVTDKSKLNDFLNTTFQEDQFIVEKFIPFEKELAVIIARSQDGSFTHLPFVETLQKDSRCDWVKGPISLKQSTSTIKRLKTFLKKINYVGVMGVEFFKNKKEILINEVAPRVHNSGHYSMTTSGPSQFDLHNACLLGLKLPKAIAIKKGFAMVNLIGSDKQVELKAVEGLHWYGKRENRPGRKMGHINVLGNSGDQALKKALKLRKELQL